MPKQHMSEIPLPLQCESERFSDLRVLDLSNNNIVELGDRACRTFYNLTDLNLSNNKLKSVSRHIRAVMNLRRLFLQKNQLTEVQPEICSLKLLE